MKRKPWPELFLFSTVFLIFIINATYVTYPDEFVNLLAGKFIISGKIPYKEFFDHHLPFAWYLSSFFLRISSGSYVFFRLIWSFFSFAALSIFGLWIRKEHKNLYLYYLIFLLFYPLITVYFWLHLFLADSLAVLFFAIVFWMLLTQTLAKKTNFKIIIFSAFLTFLIIFSSLTYFYLGLALYFWQFYLIRSDFRKIFIFIKYALSPYIIYFIYLVISRSWQDFYLANIIYNTEHYIDIPNYVKGRLFNPLKFGFTLIFNFWEGFLPRLATIKDLNLYLPVSTLTALGAFVLLILLLSKSAFIGLIFFFLLSFSAPRSNLQKAMFETDYQAGMFVMLGISAAIIALYLLKHLETKEILINDLKRISHLLLSTLLLFTFLFLLKNTYDKWYFRYTQKMPSIYDKADTAVFLNEILEEDDYYWVGPYEPQEIFFVEKGRLPGKYISVMPQFKQNEKIKSTFIEQFEKNPPRIIVFKWNTGIFGTPTDQFADFFLEWMKDKYTRLDNFDNIKILKNPTSVKLEINLFLLNSKKDKTLEKLKKYGYIE